MCRFEVCGMLIATSCNVHMVRFAVITNDYAVVAAQLLSVSSSEFGEYIKSFQFTVQSLQHICRQAIRHSMRSNVLYAAKMLPLPVKMQNYLVFDDS